MRSDDGSEFSWVRNRATMAWLVLLFLTLLSWWIGFDHGLARLSAARYMTPVLIIVAFLKIRLVISYFMRVKEAPLALRLLLDAWVVGVGGAILLLFWLNQA